MTRLSKRVEWFPSKAAAERDEPSLILALAGGWWLEEWVYTHDEDDGAEGWPMRRWRMDGRSLQHVDRVARDLLAHGVTPTTSGGRGVCGESDVVYGQPMDRWLRAEARAARVVAR
jgi:hypothetical protein